MAALLLLLLLLLLQQPALAAAQPAQQRRQAAGSSCMPSLTRSWRRPSAEALLLQLQTAQRWLLPLQQQRRSLCLQLAAAGAGAVWAALPAVQLLPVLRLLQQQEAPLVLQQRASPLLEWPTTSMASQWWWQT